ncbi:hypothetical protein BDR07DRAFT_1493684 [Suillus spraguei]|nr:hypothetical protein BDR07DRAFT_1493684 [Suillus spraguei]
MAQESSHADRAVWTDTETDQLLLYLFNNWDKVGDTGNFKDVTYNGAAEAISEYLQSGPQKTGEMCKTKWASLKQTYNAIQKYHQQSGVHWDNTKGANIEGEAVGSVWNEYISKKGNSVMWPFHVSGWRHFERMDNIIPQGSGARGCTGYQPHTAIPPLLNSSSSTSASTAEDTASLPTLQGPMSIMSRTSTKRSHSDMVHTPTNSVSIQRELPTTTQMLPPPLLPPPCPELGSLKKAKTVSDHARSGITKESNADVKMSKATTTVVSKATTAVAMMGFQSSVNHLSDVISECMVYPEDRVMDQRSRAMQMLQVEDADWSFGERLMADGTTSLCYGRCSY